MSEVVRGERMHSGGRWRGTQADCVPSYPRLTLDFHTNKRIIDEVVRFKLPISLWPALILVP